jgi:hypothetical protein
VLQLCNISDTIALKLQNGQIMLRPQLPQALQGRNAIARKNEHLQLQQCLQPVRVFQKICAQVQVSELRAGVEVVDALQRIAADVERRESSEPAAASVEIKLALE